VPRRGVSRCCQRTNAGWARTQRGVGTLRSLFVPPPSRCLSSLPEAPCGVSAVYGDRRRHLPSSLALPLRSASRSVTSEGIFRQMRMPSPDSRAARVPRLRPDFDLMYKNKPVRRARSITSETSRIRVASFSSGFCFLSDASRQRIARRSFTRPRCEPAVFDGRFNTGSNTGDPARGMTFTRMFSVLPSSSHPPTVLPERSRAGDKRYREYACLSALRSRKDKVDAEVTFRETSPSFAAAFVRESTARSRGYFMRKPGGVGYHFRSRILGYRAAVAREQKISRL